ncbi:hypothetical protein E5288_WYG002871 [Bos mutus]|uniref:Coiled-coil-helix-coiled-coil-helix domain-containing protein 3, mitochondrial n=1 Tax=Bos mutus TaxID=72004 RepID=A0A6B0RRZ9_9CETA|nr:hypothetical protein [Bos mutus]
MGGTASTRRVTFEADENENITVVKGIRLSENVIDRMKETSPSGPKSQRYSGTYGASGDTAGLALHVCSKLRLEKCAVSLACIGVAIRKEDWNMINQCELVHAAAQPHLFSDEELKRRVAEELALEQAKKESENQKRLKQSKELDAEKAFANEQLTRAILRERISNEEERAKAKHLALRVDPFLFLNLSDSQEHSWLMAWNHNSETKAKQLEEKDRVIKKQDAFYKEQLARLEERFKAKDVAPKLELFEPQFRGFPRFCHRINSSNQINVRNIPFSQLPLSQAFLRLTSVIAFPLRLQYGSSPVSGMLTTCSVPRYRAELTLTILGGSTRISLWKVVFAMFRRFLRFSWTFKGTFSEVIEYITASLSSVEFTDCEKLQSLIQ